MHQYSASFRVFAETSDHRLIREKTGLITSDQNLDNGEDSLDEEASSELWILDSPLPEQAPLGEHLAWLSEKLEPHKAFFQALQGRGVKMDIFCTFTSEPNHCSLNLQPEALGLCVAWQLPFRVSIIAG